MARKLTLKIEALRIEQFEVQPAVDRADHREDGA